MATPHDARAKNILDVMLDDLGTLEREFEVASLKPQRADLRFAPSPEHTEERRALGLIGRMTDDPCMFEPFQEAPSFEDVEACARKLLNARHAGTLDPTRAVERAWLLCGGRPDGAIARWNALPMPHWPTGFYALHGLPLALVVLSELPHADDTVALRLMGAGTTLRAAIGDLRSRYGAVPRGDRLFEVVVQDLLLARGEGEASQENVMVDTTEARALIKRVWNAGHTQGISRGEQRALTRQFEHRLARPLSPEEHATLAARFESVGPERLGDLVLDLDADALAAWLADPDAR